jgi:predicted MPP superfamily phosphohydrolase
MAFLPKNASGLTRRQVLKAFAASGIAVGGSGILYGSLEQHWRRTTAYRVKSVSWPGHYQPLKIAIAGDFHVGCPAVGLETLADIVADINALKADIVLLPGDFLNSVEGLYCLNGIYIDPDALAATFSKLEAPFGVFSVLGNHDWNNAPAHLRYRLEKIGICVLENEATQISINGDPLWITGIGDDSTGHADLSRTFAQVCGTAPVIAMCHSPATFLDIQSYAGFRPALTVAGHTHGGQICLPLVGALMKPNARVPWRYFYGHVREDDCDLVVTSGIGTSIFPLRVGMMPEIVSLDLAAAP